MNRYVLTESEEKLKKASFYTFVPVFGAIFGYSINSGMKIIWLMLAIFGLVMMISQMRLIPARVRQAALICQTGIFIVLALFMVTDIFSIPWIIKEALFWIVLIAYFYYYFVKELYCGKFLDD